MNGPRTAPPFAQASALVVLLENGGHIHGVTLPAWLRAAIDFASEAYAKALLRLYGAYRHYDKVLLLEDDEATSERFVATLCGLEGYRTDIFLFVHGIQGGVLGYGGRVLGAETFARLRTERSALNLGAVYGLNCYGASLAAHWRALGADAVGGARGVNWFPEPGLSGFLLAYLGGQSFAASLERSNRAVTWLGGRLLGREHVALRSSCLELFGNAELRSPGRTP